MGRASDRVQWSPALYRRSILPLMTDPTPSPLAGAAAVAFVATTSAEEARAFYGGTLGLPIVHADPFGVVFDAGGTQLRVAIVEQLTPQPHTVLGWRVDDVRAAVRALVAKGITFERFPGMGQDAEGLWLPPGGSAGIAWFKDPAGNLLSLSGG
jgi:catechol 2,3-dioxygenase-like lactoylglutathione lyase family enzyme